MSAKPKSAWVFPGQGAQRKGMGGDLFDRFPDLCAVADRVIGVPVAELCASESALRDTRYVQPALFVVNALSYLAVHDEGPPDFLAGHSLGEYNALFAAGCLDFGTALALVCRRGDVMARTTVAGGMVAVLGPDLSVLPGLLADAGLTDVDIANDNADDQVVLAGPDDSLTTAAKAIRAAGAGRCVPLAVAAPFHSRYMLPAAREFEDVLADVRFAPPRVPVISNVTARPHDPALIGHLLALQVRTPVRWRETMRYLVDHDVREVRELGPGKVLAGLWRPVLAAAPPVPERTVTPESLGSAAFRADYGVNRAYLAGSMYHGISSVDLVARMGKAGLLGFFGAGGLGFDEVATVLRELTADPGPGRFGMNLLAMPDNPALEARLADLYVRHDVRYVEAAGYTGITAPLVRFRFAGAYTAPDGTPTATRHVLAKVSRPEVAEAFLRPPPREVLDELVARGGLTAEEARAAARLPVAGDLCAEADSAGHTDARNAVTLIPDMVLLRDRYPYPKPVRVGAAGGLGTPHAIAAAFVLGADFVVTGSINQCTPEAGTSDEVKDMLAQAGVQDTAYAPAGDMFEFGSRVQVLRRGTMFAARANQLLQVYQRYGGWDEVPEPTRRGIERTTFRKPFDEVWRDTERHYRDTGRAGLVADADAKRRMALAFRWYFAHTTGAALRGDAEERANFQVHTGPAIGAFNRLVHGTELADWRLRHVDVIAELLMRRAADIVASRRSDQ
ncbi:trans-AT polyketide synthase/acyltransferase/oxidoreductase domain-containing protein [Saccharothrix tamanrassetensis]|uniref:[acyl-carrier-protein] S-malonyltransferase n=1 Tax=Saccharothrix tamanrassetensis TaxID=1051531 RepID=A0A841CBN4_9PSEU|nr:ACP S-malonyltransferase [Saccharothrix tamanrassetensis]MBB5953764.1 trans-AT polyketide synthase/acyltransferase/oxidoreductase domain-containing protein [Saccharothrix tamanrassetensis]